MKKLLCIIGSCFMIVFVALSSSFAATYYIDIGNGNDSNNGTSASTPFKYLPYDTRFSGSCRPAAGDTFYFKRGTIYTPSPAATTYMFRSLTSGSEGSPITFGAYGTGENPIICGGKPIDESQFSLYSGSVYRATNEALGITGIDLYSLYEADKWEDMTVRADWYADCGTTTPGRCEFYQTGTAAGDYVYIHTSTDASPVGMDIYVMWTQFGFGRNGNVHHLKFENLTIQGFWKYGIYISGAGTYNGYALILDHCKFLFSEGSAYCYYGPIWMHDCDVTHMINVQESKGGAIPNCGASSDKSGLVEDCRFLRYENGLFFNETGPVPHVVRRCLFVGLINGVYQAGMDTSEHAIRTKGDGIAIDIYRNVFYDAGNDFYFDNGGLSDNAGPIRVWNNTIYEDRAGDFPHKAIVDIYYTNNWQLDLRNNVFYRRTVVANSHTYQICDPNYAEFWTDYNYYLNDGNPYEIHSYYDAYNGDTRNRFYELEGVENFKNYITAQAAKYSDGIGRAEHSKMAASSTAVNVFISTTYGDANFLRLKSGSPLINAGCEISTGENGIDKDGNGVNGAYDIGAFEYSGSATTPQTPENLRISDTP